MPPDLVVLGVAVGAHGVTGHVRVRFYGDGPEALLNAPEVWLAASENSANKQHFDVKYAGNARSDEVRLKLSGVEGRDAAIALRGQLVMGDANRLAVLPQGEFYWHELVGCRVEERNGHVVGTVVEIWETGAHDVLVIESEEGKRLLLSAARELVPEIDLAAKRIVCESIPGLFDQP